MNPRSEAATPASGAPSAASATSLPAVIDPGTGEVLDALDAIPSDRLAEVWVALRERRQALDAMTRALNDELLTRLHAADRRLAVVGDYEVKIEPTREKVWDTDELEGTLRDLIERGELAAREVTELLHHEVKVDGHAANRLMARLSGSTLSAVERCFRWQPKGGRERIRVERAIALPAPDQEPTT